MRKELDMSKKYDYEGKRVAFNYEYFKELVDAKAKEEQCGNTWIYKEIATHLNWSVDDSTSKIFRWYKGLNAPVDLTIVKDVANYFGVDFNLLLVDQIIGKKKTMENSNKQLVVAPLKKIQQYELLRVKDEILDFIYDNYTSAFWDDYICSERTYLDEKNNLSFRLLNRKRDTYNVHDYFTADELERIKDERKMEEKALKSKNKKNTPDVSLLDEYRNVIEYAPMYELFRKIERSLSILPFELVNRIIQIVVNIIPDQGQYLSELCAAGVLNYDYISFDDVLQPDFIFDGDMDNPNDEDTKKNSMYNIVMNIHKEFNELINKYCD